MSQKRKLLLLLVLMTVLSVAFAIITSAVMSDDNLTDEDVLDTEAGQEEADTKSSKYEVKPDTWVFTDALGRTSLTNADVGDPREDKTLAMFYWTWHTIQIGANKQEPLNVNDYMLEHPEIKNDYTSPLWPTGGTAYFWNEPIFGYYRGSDAWVVRKQGEMLANAGVDAIFTDNTNGVNLWKES